MAFLVPPVVSVETAATSSSKLSLNRSVVPTIDLKLDGLKVRLRMQRLRHIVQELGELRRAPRS